MERSVENDGTNQGRVGRKPALNAQHIETLRAITREQPRSSLEEVTRELHRRYIALPQQRKIFASLKNYLPFLNMNVLYDNSRLRQELGNQVWPGWGEAET